MTSRLKSNASDSDVSDRDAANLFYKLFRKSLRTLLGNSTGEAVLLLVKRSLQRDIDEALLKNPREVYDELSRIFGVGTRVLMNVIVSNINKECGLDVKPEKFVELMCSEDRGKLEEMRSIMRLIAKSYKKVIERAC